MLLEAFEYEVTVQVYFKLFLHFFFSRILIQIYINYGFVFEIFDFTVAVTIIYNLSGDLFVCFVKELQCNHYIWQTSDHLFDRLYA